jgi:hypothetical protein
MGMLGQIDDREAPVTETQYAIAVTSAMVGPTPAQPFVHYFDSRQIGRGAIETQFTTESAHCY